MEDRSDKSKVISDLVRNIKVLNQLAASVIKEKYIPKWRKDEILESNFCEKNFNQNSTKYSFEQLLT